MLKLLEHSNILKSRYISLCHYSISIPLIPSTSTPPQLINHKYYRGLCVQRVGLRWQLNLLVDYCDRGMSADAIHCELLDSFIFSRKCAAIDTR
jgi:hypothetical protein